MEKLERKELKGRMWGEKLKNYNKAIDEKVVPNRREKKNLMGMERNNTGKRSGKGERVER